MESYTRRMTDNCLKRLIIDLQMLKDLVAKRMLKLQQSAVYSGTVSALRRKVAILERRNMQLEDKADRLQTSIMNLYSEVGYSYGSLFQCS